MCVQIDAHEVAGEVAGNPDGIHGLCDADRLSVDLDEIR
jgi:hypothetical protein